MQEARLANGASGHMNARSGAGVPGHVNYFGKRKAPPDVRTDGALGKRETGRLVATSTARAGRVFRERVLRRWRGELHEARIERVSSDLPGREHQFRTSRLTLANMKKLTPPG